MQELAGKPYCLNIAIEILKIVLGRTFVKAQIFTWLLRLVIATPYRLKYRAGLGAPFMLSLMN